MLVYVRSNKIKSNKDPISIDIVPHFIREKVDRENKIRQKESFWHEHKAYFIVMPEFLQETEMNGCMMDKQVHRDPQRLGRFYKNISKRMCMTFKKSTSLQDFLDNMKDWLCLEPDNCMFWKFDTQTEWLVPLFQQKALKEAKTRKLIAFFKFQIEKIDF